MPRHFTTTLNGPPEKTALSVVIPAYHNQGLLKKNLPPLLSEIQTRAAGDEIIVVDDAGQDGLEEFLTAAFPTVIYVRNRTNLGFGETCNAGIAEAKNPLLLLLNTDVRISAGFLDVLIRHFADDALFCVVPKVIRPGAPDVCQSLTSFSYDRGYFRLMWDQRTTGTEVVPVIFPTGCCVLIDAAKLRSLGGIDPVFRPFYWEDVDLGYMAWKRGWKCLCDQSVTVLHEESATIGKGTTSRRKGRMGERNRCLFIWKNITDWDWIAWHWLTILPRACKLWLRGKPDLMFGFWAALPRLPESLRSRRRLRHLLVRRDREVESRFSTMSGDILASSEQAEEPVRAV
jgi:GT2 family glycosyltransferase